MNFNNTRSKNLVILIATIAATGGLLFGFDTGVISGAQNFLQDPLGWGINDEQLEWVTTAVLIGAVLGAALSGRVSDILGRKKVIIIASVIFAVGAIATGAAPNVSLLVIGRIIIGIAIGIASFSVPMYISEISPTRSRGALVTMNQLMITIGILVSYISDYLIANNANPFSWRWMFYVGFFPALILFVGMFFVPETPRWLIISEVFPLKVRGVGMSLGSLSNWLFNGIVAFTFLKLVNALSPAGAFWLYAALGILGIIWGFKFIPETKGITLKKIEDNWREGKKPGDFKE